MEPETTSETKPTLSPDKYKSSETADNAPETRTNLGKAIADWSNLNDIFVKVFETNAKVINLKILGLAIALVILLYAIIGLWRFLLKQFPDKGLELIDSVLLWIIK